VAVPVFSVESLENTIFIDACLTIECNFDWIHRISTNKIFRLKGELFSYLGYLGSRKCELILRISSHFPTR